MQKRRTFNSPPNLISTYHTSRHSGNALDEKVVCKVKVCILYHILHLDRMYILVSLGEIEIFFYLLLCRVSLSRYEKYKYF
nr:MAG TPA: hypothetical protein [Caudoviricetes sp.]